MIGYSLPSSNFEPPQGLKSYPVIFSFPLDVLPPTQDHWPNIVSLLSQDISKEVDKGILYFSYSNAKMNVQWTYFLARDRLEPRVVLVLLCKGIRKKNDQLISEFVQNVRENVRLMCTVFKLIRPKILS